MEKNNNYTKVLMNKIKKNNNIVFGIGSEYSNFSYVLGINEYNTVIYKLINGKIHHVSYHRVEDMPEFEWKENEEERSFEDFTKCSEIDGDYLKIIVKRQNVYKEVSLAINLRCIKENSFKYKLLNMASCYLDKYNLVM